jgi:hypothetical protein
MINWQDALSLLIHRSEEKKNRKLYLMDRALHKKLFIYFVLEFQRKNFPYQKTRSFINFYNAWLTAYRGDGSDKLIQHELDEIWAYAQENKKVELCELQIYWKQLGKGKYFYSSSDMAKLEHKLTKILKSWKTAYYRVQEVHGFCVDIDGQAFWWRQGRARLEREADSLLAIEACFLRHEKDALEYICDTGFLRRSWCWFAYGMNPMQKYPTIIFMTNETGSETWVKEKDLDR